MTILTLEAGSVDRRQPRLHARRHRIFFEQIARLVAIPKLHAVCEFGGLHIGAY